MSIQFKFDPEKRDPIDPTTTQTNGTRAAHGEAGLLAALASR